MLVVLGLFVCCLLCVTSLFVVGLIGLLVCLFVDWFVVCASLLIFIRPCW